MKKIYGVFFLTLLLLGCKKEEPLPSPTDSALHFSIQHIWEDQNLEFETKSYTTPGGDSVRFSKTSYLLSEFKLQNQAGEYIALPNSFAFINPRKEYTTFSFDSIPYGNYKAITFMIGLVDSVNTSDPNQYPPEHPLNPILNGMHWDWNQGYVFYTMEGYYYDPDEKLFSIHMAFANNRVRCRLEEPFIYDGGTNINLLFDMKEVFQNPVEYVFSEHGDFTHEDDGLAFLIGKNLTTVFSVKSIQ